MKIQYDHQIFSFQKYGGISRYFCELINNLNNDKDIKIRLPLLISNNCYLSNQMFVKYSNFFPNKDFKGKKRIILKMNMIYSNYKLKKKDFDIFHPTYYDPYFLKKIGNRPFVLTVYDMIHEKFSNYFNVNDNTSKNKRLLCEMATKIIAISEHTKKDLIEILDIEPSKIEVIYLGNSMLNSSNTLKVSTPSRYILFVGARSGYKNFDTFIVAAARVLNSDQSLSMVCAGGGRLSSKEISLFNKLNISNRVFQYSLDDDSLASLYRQADLFVFPSMHEGFGIPLLEAFSCDCPTVCSRSSSLPEIAGDAALYFDPLDTDSIHSTMVEVLANRELREELIKKGQKRLKLFSWQKCAAETKKVYESIL